MNRFSNYILMALTLLLSACGGSCDGPAVPLSQIQNLRNSLFGTSGPRGALVIPNPIEALNSGHVMATDPALANVDILLSLPDLINPQRLENDFLKVRIRTTGDASSILASPDSNGQFAFPILDDHYGETMAYFSIQNLIHYIETIGLSVLRTRPFYVMVNAETTDPSRVNAYYVHGYGNEKSPRMIRIMGDTDFPLRAERDIFWHEFGHHLNEAMSHEVGFDYATDMGSYNTEGAALHECLADILSMSVAGKPFIGKWAARNFSGFAPGDPLRSAIDSTGTLSFAEVATSDGQGNFPERYKVGEWCTRVLWQIRTALVKENTATGSVKFERLVFHALEYLKRDASLQQFYGALQQTDKSLYCGGHEETIKTAFTSRGFPTNPPSLSRPLDFSARPKRSGSTLSFEFAVRNPNEVLARNVRLILEAVDPGLYPTIYLQGLGDLAPGQTVGVGGGGSLGPEWSVEGTLDTRASTQTRYRLRLVPENGSETVLTQDINQ